MPKIQGTGLPEAIRTHLPLRLKDRQMSEEDLYKLKLWRESEPDAPDGPCLTEGVGHHMPAGRIDRLRAGTVEAIVAATLAAASAAETRSASELLRRLALRLSERAKIIVAAQTIAVRGV